MCAIYEITKDDIKKFISQCIIKNEPIFRLSCFFCTIILSWVCFCDFIGISICIISLFIHLMNIVFKITILFSSLFIMMKVFKKKILNSRSQE